MAAHSVTYGYARVSKADDEARKLETQLRLFNDQGVWPNLIYRDVASGRSLDRSGWGDLTEVIRPGDTIVVAFLDRFSRNFGEGVRIQAALKANVAGHQTGQRGCNSRSRGAEVMCSRCSRCSRV